MYDLMDHLNQLQNHPQLSQYCDYFIQKTKEALHSNKQSQIPLWISLIQNLPSIEKVYPYNKDGVICIEQYNPLSSPVRLDIEHTLKQFCPWRVGPYSIHGLLLDAEWRSDLKWKKLQQTSGSLRGKTVLDIGCNNGYFSWQMLLSGAALVIGIDPYVANTFQFSCINHFCKPLPIMMLPIALQQMPHSVELFDTIFSMGVLFHQRSPFDHLLHCKEILCNQGELFLETLIINGKTGDVLVPENRYAKMRNVWFIPSALTLESWLKRCGMKEIDIIDIWDTSLQEQRQTEWMQYESLEHFLDKKDPSKTIEGHPAPKRILIKSKKQ